MNCPDCKKKMEETYCGNTHKELVCFRCDCGWATNRYKPITEIITDLPLDRFINGCENRDLMERTVDCRLCKYGKDHCKKEQIKVIKSIKTTIMMGYKLKSKVKSSPYLNIKQEAFEYINLDNIVEFMPIRLVEIKLREEMTSPLMKNNFEKINRVVAWKGKAKTGSQVNYYLTEKQLYQKRR